MKPFNTLSPREKIFRRIYFGLLVAFLLFLLFLFSLIFVYFAVRREPDFYRQAVQLTPEAARPKSEATVRKLTQLYTETQQPESEWDIILSQDEINAWFTVELEGSNAGTLPPGIDRPRVSIHDGKIDLAAHLEYGAAKGVIHLSGSAKMWEPNLLAIRIRNVNFGLIPFSKDTAIQILTDAIRSNGLDIEQAEEGGDPVILLKLSPKAKNKIPIMLDDVRIEGDELRFSGSTGKK